MKSYVMMFVAGGYAAPVFRSILFDISEAPADARGWSFALHPATLVAEALERVDAIGSCRFCTLVVCKRCRCVDSVIKEYDVGEFAEWFPWLLITRFWGATFQEEQAHGADKSVFGLRFFDTSAEDGPGGGESLVQRDDSALLASATIRLLPSLTHPLTYPRRRWHP